MNAFLFSCIKPRVELKDNLYGDKAVITAVNVFRYNEVKNELNYKDSVTGYQSVTVSSIVTVDAPEYKVDIVTSKGTDLTHIGIRITNYAKLVEPLDGAPVAGEIGDFSRGPYTYRLHSSDGTVHDWALSFSVAL